MHQYASCTSTNSKPLTEQHKTSTWTNIDEASPVYQHARSHARLTWPPGLPTGSEVWFQFLVEDGSTAAGITLSNGVRATTP